MPRKTRYEIEAERAEPPEGTEAYWKLRRVEASAKKQMLEAQHRKLLIDKMNRELISQEEVRDVFNRVFSAYRQATREIGRRYGQDAVQILRAAERSALRVRDEEDRKCQPIQSTSTSGSHSTTSKSAKGQSRNSRKKKS